MIERAQGIVLRTRRLTETSLIVSWLTPEFGRISTVARAALRPKSPFRGKLDLFYEAEFSFSRSRRSELHTLAEISLRDSHTALRRELAHVEHASGAAALIEQSTERETPMPEIFELLRGFLHAIPLAPPGQAQLMFAFELKLLGELGLSPDAENRGLTAGSIQVMKTLAAGDWDAVARIKLSAAQERELGKFLRGFLAFHLDRIPAKATRPKGR